MAEEQSTNEEWNEVDVKASEEEKKVDYEVEDEVVEEKAIPLVQAKEEVVEVVEKVEEVPKELEGIETKGAQKRIKQLVKQAMLHLIKQLTNNK